MFDFSSGELLLIALAVLIFIKPKDLPVVLRTVGQWTGKIRRMAGEFQDQFREAIREAEMSDIKKDIDEATGKLGSGLTDPFKDLQEATEWKPPETTSTTPPAADAPPAPPAEAITAQPAATTAAAQAAPAEAAPAPAAEPAAATSEPAATPPPAGGDRAA
jgi:sec-independent protein translocase protein TatB